MRRAGGATRTEHDTLGAVEVPAGRLWGAQTERARQHFPTGALPVWRWPRGVIRALGLVKAAAADANGQLGEVPRALALRIRKAAEEVAAGRWDAEFPLGVFQTGSGTHTNMNANEVIAAIANRDRGRGRTLAAVHPNDHVNRGQSSNDVFPAVMHLATLEALAGLVAAVDGLLAHLTRHARAWRHLPMLGRTHFQDATPIMLGDVVSGWRTQLHGARDALVDSRRGLYELPLGATAVGTGLNAHPRFGAVAVAELTRRTGLPLTTAGDLVAALSAHDALARTSAATRGLATALFRIANDIRFYASGPRAGIGELVLPANEPGSSIMPGKINPSQCEAMTMAAVYAIGCDAAVTWANAQAALQLNVYKPILLHEVLSPIEVLTGTLEGFARLAVAGLAPNRARIEAHLASSLMLVTALAPHIGYDRAAAIALAAHEHGSSLREAALASGQVTGDQFDRWVSPAAMARPHRAPTARRRRVRR